jgi:hypothetical protein
MRPHLNPLPEGEEDAKRLVREVPISVWRFWLATAVVIVTVVAVWKFIDYQMRPPPPPHPVNTPAPSP